MSPQVCSGECVSAHWVYQHTQKKRLKFPLPSLILVKRFHSLQILLSFLQFLQVQHLYKHPLWHESWSLVWQHLSLFLSHTHQKPIHTHKDLSLHVLKGQQIKMFVYSRRYPKMLSKSPLQDFFPFWQWCPYLKEAIKVSYINKLFLGSFVCHGQGIREALYAMARGIAWEFEGIRGLKVAQTRGLGGQAPPENV